MSVELVRASLNLTEEEKKTCIALLTYLKEAFDPSFHIGLWINDKIRQLAIANPETPMPVTEVVVSALEYLVPKLNIRVEIIHKPNMVSWQMVNYVFNVGRVHFVF